MEKALEAAWMIAEQDRKLAEAVAREQGRLRNFIRRRVSDDAEAEDILQDVFYELVEAYRLMKPIEQVGAWMFRVARNRIIDAFRKKKPEALAAQTIRANEDSEPMTLEELLPSPGAGPEAEYARNVLLDELEGRSFKEISAETGVSVNTLLSRKHQAVLHLRRQLRTIYDEFTDGTGWRLV
jgi:RNA polymerase sigma factor (sigma-70 family)